MPTISELISDKNKEKIMQSTKNRTNQNSTYEVLKGRDVKELNRTVSLKPKASSSFSSGNDTIVGARVVSQDFIGQTPNLNSSLGVNAADGTDGTFLDQNKGAITDILSGVTSSILGGGKSSTSSGGGYVPPSPTESKKILGMPAWLFWVLISIVVLIIVIVVIRKMSK